MQPKVSLKQSVRIKKTAAELNVLDMSKKNKILCLPLVYYL